MGKKSRMKGHGFEREVSILFRQIFPNSRRQLEYHEDDAQGIDIQGTDPYKIQCKRFKKYASITAINEVQCDRLLGDIPVLITRGDNTETMAVLPLSDLLNLIRTAKRVGK